MDAKFQASVLFDKSLFNNWNMYGIKHNRVRLLQENNEQ